MLGIGRNQEQKNLKAAAKDTRARGLRRQASRTSDPMKQIRLNSQAHDLEAAADDLRNGRT